MIGYKPTSSELTLLLWWAFSFLKSRPLVRDEEPDNHEDDERDYCAYEESHLGEDPTFGTVEPLRVSLVEPVAYQFQLHIGNPQ